MAIVLLEWLEYLNVFRIELFKQLNWFWINWNLIKWSQIKMKLNLVCKKELRYYEIEFGFKIYWAGLEYNLRVVY